MQTRTSLRRKLLLSYAVLMLGILGVSSWSIYHLAQLGQSVRQIMSNNYRSVIYAQIMKESLERQDSAMLFHLAGDDREATRQYEANRQKFIRYFDEAAHNVTEEGELEVIHAIGRQFQDYSGSAQAFLRNPAARRDDYFRRLAPAVGRLKQRCDDLLQLNQNAMLRAQRWAEQQTEVATHAEILLAVGLLIMGVIYALRYSRTLIAPLHGLAMAAKRIGEGEWDATIQVSTGDEVEMLADEFNRMTAKLREYRTREAARLHVAEAKSDAAINSLSAPVIVTDAGAAIVRLNRAAELSFGPERECLGQPVDRLGLPLLSAAIRKAIQARTMVAADEEHDPATLTVEHRERSYLVSTAPLIQPAGEVAGTVTVLSDITRLRELDRLKDEFISVASHELRTPLTALQMSVNLLAEGSAGPLSEPQARLVAMAVADTRRLDVLTKDLLDLTRLEAGVTVFHRRPIGVRDFLELALRPFYPQAEAHNVALEAQLPAGLPQVSGDPEQLARVVSNLVDNALRYTPPGGTVRVAAAREDGAVRVTVTDTGEGISAAHLAHVFERFYQVPGAATGGAGLGLPIARKIVEAHGGIMRVESTPGVQTKFYFTVPLAQGTVPLAPADAVPELPRKSEERS